MLIHRSQPGERFTIIPNDTLRDARLSYLARGVLAEILTRPDDWSTTADAIASRAQRDRARAGEGRRAIRAAFAELVTARYLFRLKRRARRGHVVTELHLFDTPQECDDDGMPVYFKLLAQFTDIPASGTSVPPAQTGIVPGRTDVPLTGTPVTGTPVTGTPVSGTSLRRLMTKTDTKTDDEDRNRADEDLRRLQSPVQVEGNGAAPGQDHHRDGHWLDPLAEAARQAAEARAARLARDTPAARLCERCGEPVRVRPGPQQAGNAAKGRYCSGKCRTAAWHARQRAAASAP